VTAIVSGRAYLPAPIRATTHATIHASSRAAILATIPAWEAVRELAPMVARIHAVTGAMEAAQPRALVVAWSDAT
jgi:hypothetical protein